MLPNAHTHTLAHLNSVRRQSYDSWTLLGSVCFLNALARLQAVHLGHVYVLDREGVSGVGGEGLCVLLVYKKRREGDGEAVFVFWCMCAVLHSRIMEAQRQNRISNKGTQIREVLIITQKAKRGGRA